ncbi:MAG: DUF935 family protein, partial [Candidatus Alcyoniella australis]|nr:DUF935 family protein [Candidatus Alcyoniella australis]
MSKELLGERATRATSAYEMRSLLGLLPNPDIVLRRAGKSITVFRELLTDDQVNACVTSRRLGVLSCEHEIEPASGHRADKKAAEICRTAFEHVDTDQLVREILNAVLFGYAPIEMLWRYEADALTLADLVGKPPEWFGYDDDNRLRFLSREQPINGELCDPRKFFAARYEAGYDNPYGSGILSKCFWPVVFKKGGLRFWLNFAEKFGTPWIEAKVPKGTDANEREMLADRLVQMVQDAVAVLEEGEELKLHGVDVKGSSDLYDRLVAVMNAAISKTVLGQTLSTEVGDKGSYAATKGHLEVRDDYIGADKRLVAVTMRKPLGLLTSLNVAGATPPVWRWFEEEDVRKDRAERDSLLREKLGVLFTPEYIGRTYNIEPETDFTLDQVAEQPQESASIDANEFSDEADAQAVVRLVGKVKDAVK